MNWKFVSILSLMIAAAGVGWGFAQARTPNVALSPQDYIDIQTLYATYARAYDTGEGDGKVWADTFTPDGIFVVGGREYVGSQELSSYVNSRFQNGGIGVIQHWNTNVIITPTPGGATASLYVMVVRVGQSSGKLPNIVIATNYHDTLAKTSEGWRLKRRAAVEQIPPLRP